MERIISLIGLFIIVGISFALSSDRKKINWRLVISGLALQLFLGLIILKTAPGRFVFEGANTFFTGLLNYTNEGTNFIFGSLNDISKFGFIFATMVLPTIIFVSSLMSILYHLGAMQVVVKMIARVMVRLMGTSGSESLAAAANIFVGQTEAPLVIKPFLASMTRSELMALMTGGMATVAGGVLAAYVGMGIDAGHLLAASVMSAPASLVCAKLMIPETEQSSSLGKVSVTMKKNTVNIIDAATVGASNGMKLAVNVAAMLLVFIALVALLNGILGALGGWMGIPSLTLEMIFGYLFAPFAWIMGVPYNECLAVGSLLGKKLVLNEFVAYLDLQKQMATLSPRAVTISTYALCGFANFGSIAIQVGGVGVLAPEKRSELAGLGLKCLVGGTFACFMTACLAGLLI